VKTIATVSILVIVGLIVFLMMQQHAQEKLRAENDLLAQQLAQLQTDNENFSNQLAQTKDSQSLANDKMNELLKLRGEVGVLEQQTNELGKLRAENQRLQNAQHEVAAQSQVTANAEQQQHQMLIQKVTDAKQGVLGFLMFAGDNQNQFPTNFSQTEKYYNDTSTLQEIETNFDIVYQGSMNLTNASQIIVLREKQAWQALNGKWMKTYGFADGHSEVHTEPNGNFDDWENQRLIAPPSQ
jgi:myosin heavy subunit